MDKLGFAQWILSPTGKRRMKTKDNAGKTSEEIDQVAVVVS